jgi:hypothetical protein
LHVQNVQGFTNRRLREESSLLYSYFPTAFAHQTNGSATVKDKSIPSPNVNILKVSFETWNFGNRQQRWRNIESRKSKSEKS